jgi:RNA polymerase sigma factor (TIGR02999 family)
VGSRDETPSRSAAADPAARQQLTRVLLDVGAGRAQASEQLLPLVYEELLVIARQRLRDERAHHTLNATALVHEAYMRLVGDTAGGWENRAHFFGAAARAMRQVLIDYARKRGRAKRGGDQPRIPLNVVDLAVEAPVEDVLAVDRAVEKLAAKDPRMAEVVQLRFYAGLSVEETAAALGMSERTVRREWSLARAWMMRELGD